MIIVGTQVARTVLVLALVGSLLSLALYPLVFGILLRERCTRSHGSPSSAS